MTASGVPVRQPVRFTDLESSSVPPFRAATQLNLVIEKPSLAVNFPSDIHPSIFTLHCEDPRHPATIRSNPSEFGGGRVFEYKLLAQLSRAVPSKFLRTDMRRCTGTGVETQDDGRTGSSEGRAKPGSVRAGTIPWRGPPATPAVAPACYVYSASARHPSDAQLHTRPVCVPSRLPTSASGTCGGAPGNSMRTTTNASKRRRSILDDERQGEVDEGAMRAGGNGAERGRGRTGTMGTRHARLAPWTFAAHAAIYGERARGTRREGGMGEEVGPRGTSRRRAGCVRGTKGRPTRLDGTTAVYAGGGEGEMRRRESGMCEEERIRGALWAVGMWARWGNEGRMPRGGEDGGLEKHAHCTATDCWSGPSGTFAAFFSATSPTSSPTTRESCSVFKGDANTRG
ncbi:hypothetical protein B0H16DRAFT_1479796 [Mycena metata]|uniref:Uncharacterized protein n=1 Tax=Mycena metata TaxID=1033252 RepID=A0AAD7MDA1_9AGAR|nr:hypothetical protein B0H16DRAFT_1479796 [Mycena metata]